MCACVSPRLSTTCNVRQTAEARVICSRESSTKSAWSEELGSVTCGLGKRRGRRAASDRSSLVGIHSLEGSWRAHLFVRPAVGAHQLGDQLPLDESLSAELFGVLAVDIPHLEMAQQAHILEVRHKRRAPTDRYNVRTDTSSGRGGEECVEAGDARGAAEVGDSLVGAHRAEESNVICHLWGQDPNAMAKRVGTQIADLNEARSSRLGSTGCAVRVR